MVLWRSKVIKHSFIKFGIAVDVDARIKQQMKQTTYDPAVLFAGKFDNGINAKLESMCHERRTMLYGPYGCVSSGLFSDGYTETMSTDQWEWLNSFLRDHTMCNLKKMNEVDFISRELDYEQITLEPVKRVKIPKPRVPKIGKKFEGINPYATMIAQRTGKDRGSCYKTIKSLLTKANQDSIDSIEHNDDLTLLILNGIHCYRTKNVWRLDTNNSLRCTKV